MAERYLKYDGKLILVNGKLLKSDFNQAVSKIPETKTITPTTTQQKVTPTDSDHELIEVIINAIESGTDTSDTTATINDVLSGKDFYNADGEKVSGTIETFNPTQVTKNSILETSNKYVDGDIEVNVELPHNLLAGSKWVQINPSEIYDKVILYFEYITGSLYYEYIHHHKDGRITTTKGDSRIHSVGTPDGFKIKLNGNYGATEYDLVREWDTPNNNYKLYLVRNGVKVFRKLDWDILELQSKTVTPNSTKQVITHDTGYDGLGTVTVEAVNTPTITYDESTGILTINNGD